MWTVTTLYASENSQSLTLPIHRHKQTHTLDTAD